jgi:hypothetical protein
VFTARYELNVLVFITETVCIYCAVRAECFSFYNRDGVCLLRGTS